MRHSERLERIPPYLFAQLERKIAEKRAAGIDVITLAIGDPDMPTFRADRRGRAARGREPVARTPTPPTAAARSSARRSPASTGAASASTLDHDSEVMPAIGAKECIFNLNLAFLDPDDVALASDPGYPVYTGGPLLAGAAAVADAAGPRARLHPRPRRDRRGDARARQAAVRQLPQQPDRRDRSRRLLRAARRVRRGERHPDRARQRLLGDDLRRLRRAVVPRHRRRQGRRRRGLLAVEGLQHDRLALRGDRRQRRTRSPPTGG